MPMIVTSAREGLPTGAMAARLAEVLPSFRWTLDDAATHTPETVLAAGRALSVMGRLGDRLVLVALNPVADGSGPPDAPDPVAAWTISRPTTDDDGMARRVLAAIAEPVLALHGAGALFRFADGADADWFDAAGLTALLARRDEDPALSGLAAFAWQGGGRGRTIAADAHAADARAADGLAADGQATAGTPPATPRHDPPVAASGSLWPEPPPPIPRRPGGFGRKGL